MSDTRVLVVPGGVKVGAVALANAALHKLVELYEQRAADPTHPAPHTVVVLRDPTQVAPATLRASAHSPALAFPPEHYPELWPALEDPHFFDGIDLVIQTSGSTAGTPRLVGLSIDALIASAKATHNALSGPGRWILALPAHHIAGAMVLLRSAVADTAPLIVDATTPFDPHALLPAIAGATQDPDVPGYLSIVPTQLAACLDAGEEVVNALRSLSAILVGGSSIRADLLERGEAAGLSLVTTYGMTETCGGCVYSGAPLHDVQVRTVDRDGHMRIAIAGPTLMTRYLVGDSPFFEEGSARWLLTSDLGRITAGGTVVIDGRIDDVVITGGLSVAPAQVLNALIASDIAQDAWVTSTQDDKWGEVVTALIVPKSMPESPEDMDALGRLVRDAVGTKLGRAYAPRRVVAVDALPYIEGVKIDRIRAKELAENETRPSRDWWR